MLLLFFLFDISIIDSNVDKMLIYDNTDIHLENNFDINFVKVNSNDLKKYISYLKIDINSFTIDNNKYYATNIDDALDQYLKNISVEEKIYYDLNGVMIDSINAVCEVNEIIKLENLTKIY